MCNLAEAHGQTLDMLDILCLFGELGMDKHAVGPDGQVESACQLCLKLPALKWTDGRTDGWVGGWMDGNADRVQQKSTNMWNRRTDRRQQCSSGNQG